MIKKTNEKIIVCGDYIERYEYKQPVYWGFQNKAQSNRGSATGLERTDLSINRARQKLYKIIMSNLNDKQKNKNLFLTLTFKKNIKDIKSANRDFSKFIMRLNFHVRFRTKYLAVPEFQKRGAIHYHVVFFNLPFITIKEMNRLWGKGSFKIENVRKINSLGSYVSKYLTKNTFDERLFQQKAFFTSRNLLRPVLWRDESHIDTFLESAIIKEVLQFKTYSSFGSETVIIKKVKLT